MHSGDLQHAWARRGPGQGPATVKLRMTDHPPCQMAKGELRRVPQHQPSAVVGYYICCPRCGFVTVAVNGSDGQILSEVEENGSLLVSFSCPVRCMLCAVLIHLDRGEATLEEDARVRRVPSS